MKFITRNALLIKYFLLVIILENFHINIWDILYAGHYNSRLANYLFWQDAVIIILYCGVAFWIKNQKNVKETRPKRGSIHPEV